MGLFTLWAVADGGYAQTTWYPGGLFLLGLTAIALFVYNGRLRRLGVAHRIALLLLAAFVLWSFLSVSWAGVPGVSLDGANRTLLYLIVFALFSLISWRPETAAVVLGVYSLGIAAIVLADVWTAAGSDQASASLINGRFAEPMGYSNAVAALCIGGVWPAAFLASCREVHWAWRGLMLAVTGLLLQVALLPQSRGSMLVFPIALVIYLAVVPRRLRAIAFLAPAIVATALAAPSILDVFTIADEGGNLSQALADARTEMVVSLIALLIVGTAAAYGDSRLKLTPTASRVARRTGGGIVAAASLAGVVIAIAAIGNPVTWAGDRWDDFKGGYDLAGFGTSRLGGDLGSNRYDFWKVAVNDQLLQSPVIGDGADNFAVPYMQYRASDEEPLYPHSLPLQVLAGTGLVGGVLFGGFIIAAVAAVALVRRQARTWLGGGIAAVALATSGYWWLHGLGDWLWAFPALTAPVFAWLGMAAGMNEGSGPVDADPHDEVPELGHGPPVPSRRGVPSWAGVAIGSLLVLVAAISLGLPWAAARDVEVAAGSWGVDPEAAYERLDRARDLNFLSASPDLAAGSIASQLGDHAQARESFTHALEREPDNWFALLQLGSVDALDGRLGVGVARLEQASALNPRSSLIAAATRRARRGNPMPLSEINRRLLRRVCSVVGNTEDTRFCK